MLPASHSAVLANLLYSHSAELVGVYDPVVGWFTHVNPAGVQLLAYPSEAAFLADPNHSLRTPPWTRAQWQKLCDRARREGHQEVEANIRRHTGEPLQGYLRMTYFEVAGQPLFLVYLTARNRLQQSERELAHSVRRFEAVFANAALGIVVCDQPGRMVSVNAQAEQLFGYAPTELLGQPLRVLLPDAAGQLLEQARAAFEEHPPRRSVAPSGTLPGRRHNGSAFPVEVSLSYFYLDEELFVVVYLLDLTAKHAADQELRTEQRHVSRLNAELEQKVIDRTNALLITLDQLERRGDELAQALAAEQELGELKSRFVSMASHEFRTPLTAVLSSADLIEDYPEGQHQAQRLKHVQRIRASVQHLNDILEEFLSVGRLQEGAIEARPVDSDLTALLPETVADLHSQFKAGQLIDWQVDCPVPMRLDASLLRKIIVNLLSNALKYSAEDTVVTVRAWCQDQHLLLRVEDQGVGIAADDQKHLFQQFFRARNVTTVPGTGLGLYIVARYLALMGGTIELRSVLDQGTTVTIQVPLISA
ncbi:sensor histidine kinase [Hymenobacter jeollabukensis]|uniref:histidine kinase n=1 Tax=Hymenobacter jeollabukensis TaxID=2025313 RepID=A0A5R8WJM4_9BACT|nr:ATP-binding protein [Hymenobacter jeollabukensis]TLM88672.1 PAS domain S-box protein [Hymenobacter jeollabukensis]